MKNPRRAAKGGVVAIVAAAGEGRRTASRVPKQFVRIDGKTMLEIAVSNLAAHPEISALVVVVPGGRVRSASRLLAAEPKVAAVVAGGARRQASVEKGLRTAAAREAEILLVHDAARPLAAADVTSAVIRTARRHGAAAPGLMPSDTVKVATSSGRVVQTFPREYLRLIQTPQAFRADWLRRAFESPEGRKLHVTDDASMVEAAGYEVRIVPGDPDNFKVTTPGDLDRLRDRLARRGRRR